MRNGKVFLRQGKASILELSEFLRANRVYAWINAVLIFVCWGDAALREDICVDTECMIYNPEGLLDDWYGLGRFALVWTKRLLRTDRFSQTTCVMAMMVTLWLCCAVVGFAVWSWSGHDRRYRYFYPVFSALFITAPVFTEQVYFSFQVFEVMLGVFLALLSMYMAGRRFYLRESGLWLVLAFACGVWAIGIYQSVAVVFLTFMAFSFLISYQEGTLRGREGKFPYLSLLIRLGVFFLSVVIAYFAVSSAVKWRSGGNGAYVENMFAWPNETVRDGLILIYREFRRLYLGESVVYTRFTIPVLGLWFLLNAVRGFRARKREFPIFVCVSLCMALSPMLMGVVLGTLLPLRTQLAYPLLLALAGGFLSTLASWGCVPAILACALLSWNQFTVTERMLDTIHSVAVQDYLNGRDLYRAIYEASTDSDQPEKGMVPVFVGALKPDINANLLRGDMVGRSIFEWDRNGTIGVSSRAIGFLRAQGFSNMEMPSPEQYALACQLAADMPCWPAAGSVVFWDGMTVVKLSDTDG